MSRVITNAMKYLRVVRNAQKADIAVAPSLVKCVPLLDSSVAVTKDHDVIQQTDRHNVSFVHPPNFIALTSQRFT